MLPTIAKIAKMDIHVKMTVLMQVLRHMTTTIAMIKQQQQNHKWQQQLQCLH